MARSAMARAGCAAPAPASDPDADCPGAAWRRRASRPPRPAPSIPACSGARLPLPHSDHRPGGDRLPDAIPPAPGRADPPAQRAAPHGLPMPGVPGWKPDTDWWRWPGPAAAVAPPGTGWAGPASLPALTPAGPPPARGATSTAGVTPVLQQIGRAHV